MRLPIILLGLLAAAFTGAIAGPLLTSPPAPAVDEDLDRRARLEARVADLEGEVTRLSHELSEPAVVPVSAPPASPPHAPDDPLADAPEPAGVGDDRVESEVRRVVAKWEKVQRETKAKAAAEKQARKDEQFLAKLQTALDLTEYQREELLGHLKTRRAVYERYKRGIAGKSEADQAPLQQALKNFIADQNAEMTKLLGVEKFERLMELTTPRKR